MTFCLAIFGCYFNAHSRDAIFRGTTIYLSTKKQNGWKPGSAELSGRAPVEWIEAMILSHDVPIKWIKKKNVKVRHSRALHDHKFTPYPAIHTQATVLLKSLSQWEACLTKNYRITSSNCWSFMCVAELNFLWNQDKNPCKVKKWIWILYFSEYVVLALGLIFKNTDLDVTQNFFSTSSLLTRCFCMNVNFPVLSD